MMEGAMDISAEDISNITLDNSWTNENGQNILYITVSVSFV